VLRCAFSPNIFENNLGNMTIIILLFLFVCLPLVFWMNKPSNNSQNDSVLKEYSFQKITHLINLLRLTNRLSIIHNYANKIQAIRTQAKTNFEHSNKDPSIFNERYLSLDAALSLNDSRDDDLVHKILENENPGRGFAYWKNGISRLESTYYSLKYLEPINNTSVIDREKHIKWILTCYCDGGFRESFDKNPSTMSTYFAISALRIIGGIQKLDTHACSAWLLNRLKRCGHDLADAYYLTASLDAIKKIDDELKKLLNTLLLEPYWNQVRTMNLERNIDFVYYFIKIANLVYDKNTSKIEELEMNISLQAENLLTKIIDEIIDNRSVTNRALKNEKNHY
jgi:hypothetical protein